MCQLLYEKAKGMKNEIFTLSKVIRVGMDDHSTTNDGITPSERDLPRK